MALTYEEKVAALTDDEKLLLEGLTRGTSMILADAPPESATSGGPSGEKYAGFILAPNGRPIISTQPIFDTAEAATARMRQLIEVCRKLWD